MFGLSPKEERLLRNLKTPSEIQDFLNKIPMNFDYHKDTCMSPRMVLRKWKCHCIEGAILAALALRFQNKKPLIVHMKAVPEDYDHIITVFKQFGKWGAISQTNHSVLRYREPVYRDLRELIMSYFHEYTNKKGIKTLRSYSIPVDLSVFDKKNWMIDEQDLWHIDRYLDKVKHYNILNKQQIKNLRKQDDIERKAGNITKWKYRG